ncbi:alpha/beta fold hydrolase [Thalassococcus sp. S3]|uniref:alpha/beta fold hydrolase n=1 Tax=Thalassococcus sp. S3 TaxID=2017482 RepID=UPI0010240D0C|nr:alpha/beta hydrolase [Thalassococcus sp. S3]QBF31446.1 alpha/beta hydrolase [Thalassococcus sp. S3]
MSVLPGFTDAVAEVNGQSIAYSVAGSGPPVLLLHGFPQNRGMWRRIAPGLAQTFTVIAADLRGYGQSSKPGDVASYSFREMANDQIALMRSLGHAQFHLVGHDRGARTSHRMALDHADAVSSLTLMDIAPTHLLLNDLSQQVAKAYYHWFFLAQPAPFPETFIGHDPDFYFESSLTGWGSARIEDFEAEALASYRECWRQPETITAMCNDYRAAIEVDFALDAADLGRKVACPALVLFGSDGAMARAYDVPATWADRLSNMKAKALPGGHFFPETAAEETLETLKAFLQSL